MRNKIAFAFLMILTIPSIWWLVGSGYFNMHDDLQVMRLYQMDKCLNDGQIPCRWSPDMVWGFGQPMFNFYSVFPYYLGMLLKIILPLTYLSTVKMLFLLSFVIAAIGMYKLAGTFWGKLGGIVSAVLYTYAPYHALDVYVRGALSESYALSLLPWMWLFLYRSINKYTLKNFLGVSLSIAFVLMTHNISTMIYLPFTLIWFIYWILIKRDMSTVIRVIAAGILAVGIASFFILPALVEQSIIQTKYLTSEYSDFRAHFVTLKQLFINRNWGDGPSIYGDTDNISFQIGWPHWWMGGFIIINTLFLAVRKKLEKKLFFLIILLAFFVSLSAFLTHSRSYIIWERIPQMAFIQFPWRMLGPTIFFLSFLAGSIRVSRNFITGLLSVSLVVITIILNYKFFIPVHYSRKVTESEKLTGVAFELQQKSAILDYLPKNVIVAPQAKAFDTPKKIFGDLNVGGFGKNSNSFYFDTDVYIDSVVEVPVMYFPGWKVYLDGLEQTVQTHGAHGLIKVSLSTGKHNIYGKFTNTPIRNIANSLTLVSIGVMVFVVLVSKKNVESDS